MGSKRSLQIFHENIRYFAVKHEINKEGKHTQPQNRKPQKSKKFET